MNMSELIKGRKEHEASLGFSIGEVNEAAASITVGSSYISQLSGDGELLKINNITYAPGGRTNWHIHQAAKAGGEVIICEAGRGFYQEWGRDALEMKAGDCKNIAPGVKFWYGAAPEDWVSFISVEVPGENVTTEYAEPVSDAEYEKLRKASEEQRVSEEAAMNAAIMHMSINEQWPYGTMKKFWPEGDSLAIEYETGKVILYHLEDGYWEPEEWVVTEE